MNLIVDVMPERRQEFYDWLVRELR